MIPPDSQQIKLCCRPEPTQHPSLVIPLHTCAERRPWRIPGDSGAVEGTERPALEDAHRKWPQARWGEEAQSRVPVGKCRAQLSRRAPGGCSRACVASLRAARPRGPEAAFPGRGQASGARLRQLHRLRNGWASRSDFQMLPVAGFLLL